MKVSVLFLHDLFIGFNCNTLMFTTVFCGCIAKLENIWVTLFLLVTGKAVLDWCEMRLY